MPRTLREVGPVDPGSVNRDQHLVFAQNRIGYVFPVQSGPFLLDGFHSLVTSFCNARIPSPHSPIVFYLIFMPLPMSLPFDPRLLLLALPLVLLLFILTRRRKPADATSTYPYVATGSLFTANELGFLRVLESAAPKSRIFGKVRLADVIGVHKGLPKSEGQRAFNRITSKHLDFVLCDLEDLRVRCVIELDDKSHQRADRRARDAFLEAALQAAQVPLVRVSSRKAYDVTALRALLSTPLGAIDEARPTPVERRVDIGAEPA